MTANAIAIIPARGASKRIPRKNLVPVTGIPLVAHSVKQAVASNHVIETIVSTDDEEIAAVAREYGAEVVERPAPLAGDEASSESALLHALDARRTRGLTDPELVVFLQPTSPVRAADDIDGAVEALLASGADSLFSATENRALIWGVRDGTLHALNYDSSSRLREQDMPEQWRENGSIYVTRVSLLRETENRLGGRIAIYPMDYWSSFQVDQPEDLELIESILTPRRAPGRPWPDRVELLVLDFDGVMTDNTALVDADGSESVRVHRGDGWGIARLRDAGVPIVVLSTEEHPVVSARCRKLGIECRQGIRDKGAALHALLAEWGVDPSEAVYVGNDVNDLGCFAAVDFAVAPADAHPQILARASYVLSRPGGAGAVRELCDLLLQRA